MSAVAEVESTELVTLPAREVALQVYSTAGGLDPLIEQIREKVIGTVYDMTTAKGRAECEAAAQREAQAKAAAEQAERERLEAIERQKQAEARAEAEKLAAEQRAKDAAEAARKAEIQRQADEAARIEAEQKAREADRAHKANINNAAVAALVAGGLTAEAAKLAVTLIAQGKVPAVRINY